MDTLKGVQYKTEDLWISYQQCVSSIDKLAHEMDIHRSAIGVEPQPTGEFKMYL